MSTCISSHGEFGSHDLDEHHTCKLCHVLDEAALREELARVRAEAAEIGAALDREHGFVKRHEATIAQLRADLKCAAEPCPGCWHCHGDYWRDDRDEETLRQRVAALEAQRDRVLALCDSSERVGKPPLADWFAGMRIAPAVLTDAIREVYAADRPCPSGCPHPYRSHGPDGCRARMGKCDLCACQEAGK